MSKQKIELGDKVRDSVTSFEGIAVARTEWLNGCIRWTLQSDKLDKDGKPQDAHTFDEPQLAVMKPKKVKQGPHDTGGPAATPRQHPGPKR